MILSRHSHPANGVGPSDFYCSVNGKPSWYFYDIINSVILFSFLYMPSGFGDGVWGGTPDINDVKRL